MGVDTKGYLRLNVSANEVFNVVTSKFDKDATIDIRNDGFGIMGNIYFKYNDEQRRLFYYITSREEDDRILFDGEKEFVTLILGY